MRRTSLTVGVAVAIVLLWVRFSSGQIQVEAGTGATFFGNAQVTYGPNGANIIVNATGSPTGVILIGATQPNVGVASVQIVPQPSVHAPDVQNLSVTFRQQPMTNGSFGFVGTVRRVGSNGAVTLGSLAVTGSPGNVGDPANPSAYFIDVDTIGVIDANNEIALDVKASGSLNAGNITRLRAASGRILGDVYAAGLVVLLDAQSTIGTTTTPITISVGQEIREIKAASVHAQIHGVSSSSTPIADLWRLQALTGGFTGSLLASTLSGGGAGVANIEVAGSLDANVTISGDILKPIWVGGGLSSGRTVQIGSSGLKSQIIFNRASSSGSWAGTVKVGTTTLSSSGYSELPSTLGGGAVGRAPFAFHSSASSPPHNMLGLGEGIREQDLWSAAVPIKIEHYGPVFVNGDIKIQCRPFNPSSSQECGWFDLTDAFEIVDPGTSGLNERTLGFRVVSGMMPRGGEYRVMLNTGDALLCRDVTGQPLVSWPTVCTGSAAKPSYLFRVISDCDNNSVDDLSQTPLPSCALNCHVADFNGNGMVTVQDVFDFLAAWFANDPDADVNNSGTISVQDVFDFLAAWFSPCP